MPTKTSEIIIIVRHWAIKRVKVTPAEIGRYLDFTSTDLTKHKNNTTLKYSLANGKISSNEIARLRKNLV